MDGNSLHFSQNRGFMELAVNYIKAVVELQYLYNSTKPAFFDLMNPCRDTFFSCDREYIIVSHPLCEQCEGILIVNTFEEGVVELSLNKRQI